MRRTPIRVIATVTVSLIGLGGLAAASAQRTAPAVRQRLAYTTTRPLNWDVFYSSDGNSRPERITDDPGLEYDPVLSPDGRWVVFTSERRGNPDLYAMELSPRGAPRLLIDADSMEDQATFTPDGEAARVRQHRFRKRTQGTFDGLSWSRDGEWLYFTRGDHRQPEREGDVWKVRRDGTDRQNLTLDSKGSDTHPAACGRDRVVFRSARDGQFDLYVTRSDGSDVRRLTNDPGNELFPVCSPDGRRVAFISDRDKPGSRLYEVYVADLAGGFANLLRITQNDVQEGHPGFSPDGEWIVFTSESGGINDEEPLVQSMTFAAQSYGEVFVHHLTTRHTIRLTHNKWEEGIPSWEAGVSSPGRR
jgi:Tol biopolymer transport system component